MRVSELAKDLKLTSKELLDKLKSLRIPAASPASTLDANSINRVRKLLAIRAPKKTVAAAAPSARAKAATTRAAASAKSTVRTKTTATKTVAAAATVTAPPLPRKVTAPPVARPAAHAAPPSAPPLASKPKPDAPPVAAPRSKTAAAAPAPKPAAPAPPAPAAPPAPPKQLELRFPITVKDLADKMEVKASEVIKYLMQQGTYASMVQPLNEAVATKVARTFNCEVLPQPTLEEQLFKAAAPDPARMTPRAPVVTFMGHVDHGKTSLLDAIREAKVAEKEAGGITQHIGAYEVAVEKGHVTFLDTPGHEAFSALRARGANVTDVVVLVVAADDGVMPQTVEAIDHARAAGVTIMVALNKVDKPEANIQKVKQQLTQYELVAEDWGGKTVMVPVSAKSRQGIDQLLEMILLQAEVLELKADPVVSAQGTVVEAKQTKERGPVTTLLVQHGTLQVGQTVVVGDLVGRVRAMADDRGHRIKEAGPSRPVEILGLPEVPRAGDRFLVVEDEKLAKTMVEHRRERRALEAITHPKRVTLEDLHQRIAEGKLKELRFILKSDVQGSLEAIVQSLEKLDDEKHEVTFKILHMGVGDINESDVILAAASDAIIAGFHVGIEPKVQVLAAAEGVDLHIYQIIYELVNAVKAAIEGLLEPKIEETLLGRAEVRKLFQVSKIGMVAGCMVTKGIVRRDATMRVIRGKDRVFEGKISNLKRVKDDAREVQEGLECGISLEGNVDFQVGDFLEAWELKKIARKLA